MRVYTYTYTLGQIIEFSKIVRYKGNTQRSIIFLCTNDEQLETEIKKKPIPFTIAQKTPIYKSNKHV